MAEAIPEAFPDWRCEVIALDVERSFWEKATILHTEYHRPPDKSTPDNPKLERDFLGQPLITIRP